MLGAPDIQIFHVRDATKEQKCDLLIARLESRTYRSSEVRLMIGHMSTIVSVLGVLDNRGHDVNMMACRCNGERVPEYR